MAKKQSSKTDHVRLRSRYRAFSLRDVQFQEFIATVPRAKAESLMDLPSYGRSWWIDERTAPDVAPDFERDVSDAPAITQSDASA